MEHFSYGKYECHAQTIAEGLAICQAMERLDQQREQRQCWESINYGHNFGWELRCACGLWKKEYLMLERDRREVCPVAMAAQAGGE